MTEDIRYMTRCLQLAANGRGHVSPNPMVGAVVVYDGRIIGEGFHAYYGGNHAEVQAIQSVKEPALLKKSTLYVNLEPCSHYGKTPPCAELIIQKQIPHVVIAALDPFPEVSGRGANRLTEAGVKVDVGVLEKEAQELNSAFYRAQWSNRPYITLKWAQSMDGYIDRTRDTAHIAPIIFSTHQTRRLVHKLRAESDAILVGTDTYLLDRPSLNVRYWAGKSPQRVVIDRNLRIPENLFVNQTDNPIWVYSQKNKRSTADVQYIDLAEEQDFLRAMLCDLKSKGIQSLLIEGGSKLQQSFIDLQLWDRVRVETSPFQLFSGIKAPLMDYKTNLSVEKKFYEKNFITTYLHTS